MSLRGECNCRWPILERNFGQNTISIESPDGTYLPTPRIVEIVKQNPFLKSISSHKLPVLQPKVKGFFFVNIVMVREPLDRIKSMYLFYRRQNPAINQESLLAQRLTFPEFISCLMEAKIDGSFSNLQSKFFLGNPTNPSSDNWPFIIRRVNEKPRA